MQNRDLAISNEESRMEQRDGSNSTSTARQDNKLNRQLNHNSKRIHRKKHNNRTVNNQ